MEKIAKFICINCQKDVKTSGFIGTNNRNHCNYCLFSKHVDEKIPGDRKSKCFGEMKPVSLTFKHEGEGKNGEIMLVHVCHKCSKVNINRIAADDDTEKILNIFEESKNLPDKLKTQITVQKIRVLEETDREEILTQLFGKKIP